MLSDFFVWFSFPCSADHERDWPSWKVVFFNALNLYRVPFSYRVFFFSGMCFVFKEKSERT